MSPLVTFFNCENSKNYNNNGFVIGTLQGSIPSFSVDERQGCEW